MTINGDDGKIVFVAEGTGTKQKRFADRGLAAAGIQRGCFVPETVSTEEYRRGDPESSGGKHRG